MIDLKALRENPARFALGAKAKGVNVDIERLVALDAQKRTLTGERERLRAEQNKIAKESGPQIGKLQGKLKGAQGPDRGILETQIEELKQRPQKLKAAIQELEQQEVGLDAEIRTLLLQVPLPPDSDVPVGAGSEGNVEIRRWHPPASELLPKGFDTKKSFAENKGFSPKTHLELVDSLKLCNFECGVKLAGSRSYILTGLGMRLHMAVQRYAIDFMVNKHGFAPMSVPTLVREETMVGTGFFPAGREQAYQVEESKRGGGYDLFLTGTGEVGLMGIHMDEILDEADLPLKYVTVSPCYRREAGAAGKDTAGLYRIHQFDKVEQVVICKADENESRAWHTKMIGFVEELLQSMELPYRLLQCCTGDLGVKNAAMVDIESWMPGRGIRPVECLSEDDHYCLTGSGDNYWSNGTPSRVQQFVDRRGHEFFLVIHNNEFLYRIPYAEIADLLVPGTLTQSAGGGKRWIFHVIEDWFSVAAGESSPRHSVNVERYKQSNAPSGDFGETHSASRLYDFQCRRLNMRYREGGSKGKGDTVFCHSLNNTVLASPRFLIPLLEIHQNADGTVNVPHVLRPYMGGVSKIG